MTLTQESLRDKRLVIFGCGYIGAAVVQHALTAGIHVTALSRNAQKLQALRAQGVHETVQADLASDDWHTRIPPWPDFVLNTVSGGGGGLDGYRHSYVEGNRSIVRWAQQGRVGLLLYTSSTGVYAQSQGEWVTEDSVPREAASQRAQILREAEDMLLGARDCLRRLVILRLAGIYGPGRHGMLDQLRSGATTLSGSGQHHLNLIHRDDAANAILKVMQTEDDRSGVYNLSDGQPARKAEAAAWVAAQLGHQPPAFDEAQSSRRGPIPDRRISNEKFTRTFDWHPAYPTYRQGYSALLSTS